MIDKLLDLSSTDTGLSDSEVLKTFVVDNPDLERLETILDDFNPFMAMGWIRQETRHSSFLAWLLDPMESHGSSDYFLAAFLFAVASENQLEEINAPSVFDIDTWDLEQCEVRLEWHNIDIMVLSETNRFVAVIENKIDSSEHSDQLQRYRNDIQTHFPDYKKLFVYLTIGGDTPSDDAYVPMSYGRIVEVAEKVLDRKQTQLSEDVSSFIAHYVEMLKRYIVEDSEIQELCRRIYTRHRRALDMIFEFRPDRMQELHEVLEALVKEKSQLTLDSSSKGYVRFTTEKLDHYPKTGSGWTSGRLLVIELDNTGGELKLKVIIGPGDQEIRTDIAERATASGNVFNKGGQKLYPKWTTIHQEKWLTRQKYAELGLEEASEQIRASFEEFVSGRLPRIEEALSG